MGDDRPECVSGDRRLPLETLRRRGAQAATGFASLGLGEDDAIAVMMRNDFPYIEASLGAGPIGAYTVSINWHFKGDEIRYILEDSGAKLLIVHADLLVNCRSDIPEGLPLLVVETPPEIVEAYAIAEADARVPPGRDAWEGWLEAFDPWNEPSKPARGHISYTSGTTGKPKGVRREPLPKANQQNVAGLVEDWFGTCRGMRTVVTGPLYHSVINTYTRGALRAEGTIILEPRFGAEALLAIIERERITHLHLVPTMFVRMLRLPADVRAKYDVSSLQMVIHGAAPCPRSVKQQMIEWWGPIIFEYYGSTEFGMASRSDSEEWLARPGTTGKAWPGRVIEIHDDDGRVLGPGEVGEIYVSLGELANFTYHNQSDQRREIERNGLVTAGDVGYLDEDGYLFLTDRKRDMIISGGVNIYPAEIEAELGNHPKVVDSAVFSIPDDEYGERVIAAIELLSDVTADEDEIITFLRERLANYKIPKKLIFKTRLPRDDAGKIRKREMREPYWSGLERRI